MAIALLPFTFLSRRVKERERKRKKEKEPNCSAPDSITMYHFAKLSGRVHGSEDCFPITAEIYKPYLSGYVNLDVIDSERELYVTVLAGFYMYHTEEKKNIMK